MLSLSIQIGYVDSTGTFVPWQGRPVYLKPSDTRITFLNGSVYLPWDENQNGDVGFTDCWKAITNGSGVATFSAVPFTDTEVHRPLDPSGNPIGPPPEWIFINPWAASGITIYRGQLLSTMSLSSPVNVPDDVTQLPENAWSVQQFQVSAQELGGKVQYGTIPFAVDTTEAAANFPVAFSGNPIVWVGQVYDKDGNFSAAGIKQDGSGVPIISPSSATIRIAPGLTSNIDVPYLAVGN